ncbi:rod shape-determining protein RodA [Candidatus Nomurabacteria bacterium RIFCSPHIGHO2_01_FULL_39_220]|uniref:Rod shape-determining protein RodA n=1 Tax=Candidatus Nomurabacteria bacterium RIFCSPLOWO2_02_FULL_40_67 TaxID=1801787 RepID=A0A1F6Y5B9_9BACT|nr:MAG: Rod shape-determining protein RodA [Parcubacteria group bacterium GW2011_GWA2_40_37]KKS12077.1 MAG: Rod shape-determining protein RodA [Parcubacteria group bacterium GW2011_GWB1_41_5]OGI61674.1 MAG: rod shape-determining protein RodA [Candidatus Nomurabacteria bacterium RBG_16_40_11]OGI69937.1 MAG: rod shape-determining protein RodA [Candidatus Nomurabacteria bacterium RIFCSPHIGHO2_01_FULL_39_220]OGI73408.1 MAG: rod shape-determining protein RodA [Candidatus Nomurabacteria bacterium RIF
MNIGNFFSKILYGIDWLIVLFILPIILAGLVTMKSFAPLEEAGFFFNKQIIWVGLGFAVFFVFSFIDFRFLKRTDVLVFIFLANSLILLALFIFGNISHGSKSWFDLGFVSFQPVDMMKLVLVLILAKYFSRRHVEIRDIKHIFISGSYAFIPFILVLLQPDFGSAMIIFLIWLGMVLVSGISKTHLLLVFVAGALIFASFWFLIFAQYQKDRIADFINPLADIHGSGYNAFQSTIAVGSGQILGKGLGFGTQSRLKFLPQPQADFVFAAFAEEWGLVGSLLILLLYGLIIYRILYSATFGAYNFEILFGMGIAIFFMSHILINIGMNLGLLPVTGIPLPLMSYGGSHLLFEFAGLGILMSMKRYSRSVHRDDTKNEFLGA